MVQEWSTPMQVDLSGHRNVTDLLLRRAQRAPQHAAFEVPTDPSDPGGQWRQVSTQEFLAEVTALAKGFIAAGVSPGDAIGIMSATRYEWAVADLASWFAGAVVVPIYDTASAEQVAAIVGDARVRLAVAGDATQLCVLDAALQQASHDTIGVWVMGDPPMNADARSLGALAARASEVSDEVLDTRRRLAGPESPATIVYTSGTTGEPKGAVLSHRNFLGQVLGIAAAYQDVVRDTGNTIIFLPLAHVLARGLQLICLASGMRIAHLADPAQVVPSLRVLRPSFLVVVPRVLEKVRAAAAQKAEDRGLGRVWRSAEHTAVSWARIAEARDDGEAVRPTLALRARHAVFDRVFYRKLRAVLGGRLDYMLSGGAALDAELSLLFRGIGVPVIEGYGLTETTAPLTGNLPRSIRSGTVGAPLPGLTVRISDAGEVLARGIGVFEGYRDPAHNEHAFVDGFFRTGDLGSLDEHGRLTLSGRLKDVIVTSTGKTVVPMRWENVVAAHPLVSHAVMVGEGRSYLSALLVLDPDELIAWAAREGVTIGVAGPGGFDEVTDERIRAELADPIAHANSLVSRAEQVRRYTVISADLNDPALITPTLKIKRRVALDRGALLVEESYAQPLHHTGN